MVMEVTPTKTLIVPQLIVGLGNPENKYEQTRHNIGFEAIDALAKAWRIPIAENRKFKGKFGEGVTSSGEKIRLLKPLTYMNLSGQAIRAVVDWYKLPLTSVLVIYDDMDLPLGRLRLRLSGSAGGHNGMKSTISHLGTQNFPRLRIGIGKPKSMSGTLERETVSYVLGKFSSTEMQIMEQVLKWTGEAIDLSLHQGVEKAMSLYNNRSLVDNPE